MVANLTTPLLGIVGTAVIGNLGQAHLLGAVAMSALVFDLIFWIFGFLRMGTVALTAQALGAGDAGEQRAVLLRALMVAAAIGIALIALQAPLAAIIYDLMGGSAAVTGAAKTYFFVRIWSAPFVLGNYVVLGWLVGLARTGRALALQIAINLLNMAVTRRSCSVSIMASPVRRWAPLWRRAWASQPGSRWCDIWAARSPCRSPGCSTANGWCACSPSTATS